MEKNNWTLEQAKLHIDLSVYLNEKAITNNYIVFDALEP